MMVVGRHRLVAQQQQCLAYLDDTAMTLQSCLLGSMTNGCGDSLGFVGKGELEAHDDDERLRFNLSIMQTFMSG